LFVGAPQQQLDQLRLVEQARCAELGDQLAIVLVVGKRRIGRQSDPQFVGDVGDDRVEHRGH
jgi:hypothetical protein